MDGPSRHLFLRLEGDGNHRFVQQEENKRPFPSIEPKSPCLCLLPSLLLQSSSRLCFSRRRVVGRHVGGGGWVGRTHFHIQIGWSVGRSVGRSETSCAYRWPLGSCSDAPIEKRARLSLWRQGEGARCSLVNVVFIAPVNPTFVNRPRP